MIFQHTNPGLGHKVNIKAKTMKKIIEFEARYYDGDYRMVRAIIWEYRYMTQRGLKRVWKHARKRMERVWWSHYDARGYCEISVKQPDDVSNRGIEAAQDIALGAN